jgi:hypothetical protein
MTSDPLQEKLSRTRAMIEGLDQNGRSSAASIRAIVREIEDVATELLNGGNPDPLLAAEVVAWATRFRPVLSPTTGYRWQQRTNYGFPVAATEYSKKLVELRRDFDATTVREGQFWRHGSLTRRIIEMYEARKMAVHRRFHRELAAELDGMSRRINGMTVMEAKRELRIDPVRMNPSELVVLRQGPVVSGGLPGLGRKRR